MTTPDLPNADARGPDAPDPGRLQDYLDDRLSADAMRDVESQLAAHAAWREELEILKQLGDVVRGAMPDASQTVAPDDFVAQVRERIEFEQRVGERNATFRGRWGRVLAFSYAAAALVVATFTVHWMLRENDSQNGPTQTAVQPAVNAPQPTESAKVREATGDPDAVKEGLAVDGRIKAPARRDGAADKSAPQGALLDKPPSADSKVRREGRKRGLGKLDEVAPGSIENKAKDDETRHGGIGGAGALSEKARVAELEAPKKKPARFEQPGGALRPGLREPSDTTIPRTGSPRTAPPPPTSPAAATAPTAGRQGKAAPQYVLSLRAADIPQARDRMNTLVALVKAKASIREAATDPSIQAHVRALRLEVVSVPRLAALEEAEARSAPAREQADDKPQDAKSEGAVTRETGSKSGADAAESDDAAGVPSNDARARGRKKAPAPAPTPSPKAPADAAPPPPASVDGMPPSRVRSFDMQVDWEVLRRLLVTRGQPVVSPPQTGAERPGTPGSSGAEFGARKQVPVRILVGR